MSSLPPSSSLTTTLPLEGGAVAALCVALLCLAMGGVMLYRELQRRRRTEAALHQEIQRLELVVAAVCDAPWELDVQHGGFTHSESWRSLLGYGSRQEGDDVRSLEHLLHPDDVLALQQAVDLVANQPEGDRLPRLDMPVRLRHAQGHWRWCRLRGAPSLRDAGGRTIRLAGGLIDEHDATLAREALHHRLHLLEAALHALPLHVYVKDAELRPVWDNGHGPQSPAPGLGQVRQELLERQALASGLPVVEVMELPVLSNAEDLTSVEIRVAPVLDAQGRLLGLLGVCQDVTRQQALTRELQEATRLAQEADQAKTQFLAAMSHEIRTPMNAILGMAEVLRETRLDREQEGFVRVLTTSGEALMAIINNILDLSRAEAGRMQVDLAPFRPAELLQRLRDLFAQRCKAKGLTLACVLDPALPDQLQGDCPRLQQILTNLMENAVKFTQEGGIRVQATLLRQHARAVEALFEVADTGPGIPESKQALIFHRFVQADASTTRQYGGSGLGLALCRELTRLLGGRIWLENDPGQGCTFYVSLLLDLPDAAGVTPDAAAEAPPLPLLATPSPPTLAGSASQADACHVLLVEDSEFNAFVVASYLKGTPCRVVTAANGEDGLKAFAEQRFDIVLMDMQMPVMDGYSATRAIRDLETVEGLPPTPVLAMTAHALDEEREKSLAAGCTAHLTKPVRRQELLDAISRFSGISLRSPRPAGEVEALLQGDEPAIGLGCPLPPDADGGEYPQDGSPIPVCVDPELKALAPTFLLSVRTKIAPFRSALAPQDMEPLLRLGHQLKGEAAAFGFPPLGGLGLQLEQAARRQDVPAAAAVLARIQDVLERIVLA